MENITPPTNKHTHTHTHTQTHTAAAAAAVVKGPVGSKREKNRREL